MLTPDQRKAVAEAVRVTQIIVLALFAGTASYMAVILLVIEPPPEPQTKLSVMAAAAGAGAIVAAIVLGAVFASQQRAEIVNSSRGEDASGGVSGGDATKALQGFQVRRIIRGAILEGAAFFNLVSYQQERQTYSLVVADVLMAGLLLLFPLRPLVEQWLDRELRTIGQLRQLRK